MAAEEEKRGSRRRGGKGASQQCIGKEMTRSSAQLSSRLTLGFLIKERRGGKARRKLQLEKKVGGRRCGRGGLHIERGDRRSLREAASMRSRSIHSRACSTFERSYHFMRRRSLQSPLSLFIFDQAVQGKWTKKRSHGDGSRPTKA